MFIIMPINQKINIMAIAEILKLKMIDDLTSLNPMQARGYDYKVYRGVHRIYRGGFLILSRACARRNF